MFLPRPRGNLFKNDYKLQVRLFKAEFDRAKESLEQSLRVEIFKAVNGIGEP